MGVWRPVPASRSRIWRAHVKPSMTDIWQSINTRSYVLVSISSSASCKESRIETVSRMKRKKALDFPRDKGKRRSWRMKIVARRNEWSDSVSLTRTREDIREEL